MCDISTSSQSCGMRHVDRCSNISFVTRLIRDPSTASPITTAEGSRPIYGGGVSSHACQTCERRHVTCMNESWHKFEGVMSHMWMWARHRLWVVLCTATVAVVSHMTCDMSHIWMSHATNESCHTYVTAVTRVSWLYVMWQVASRMTDCCHCCCMHIAVCIFAVYMLVCTCGVYMLVYTCWCIHVCVYMLLCTCCRILVAVYRTTWDPWLTHIQMCGLTHIHMCDMTQFVRVTCLIYMCDMTHSCL